MRPQPGQIIIDGATGEVVEVAETQSGLVMRHELSPQAQAALEKIGNQLIVARRNAPWLTAAAGLVAGVTIAALWWGTTSAEARRKQRARRQRKARGAKH